MSKNLQSRNRLGVTMRASCIAGAVAAVAAIGAGVAAQAAGAATTLPTPPKSGPLHIEANIALGVSSPVGGQFVSFAEAPDGAVFFNNGSVIDVVESTGAPQVAEHASGKILGLAASDSDLYVLAGRTVTDYSRSTGAVVEKWVLPSSISTPTSGGLFARPGVVWLWSDAATDASGFQYATITALTAHSTTRVIDKTADPYVIDSDANGFVYYANEAGRLVRGSANGTRFVSPDPISAPFGIAINNGHLITETYANNAPLLTYWYMTSLNRISTYKLKDVFGMTVANTGAGLLGWTTSDGPATSELVGRAGNTGTISDGLTITGAYQILEGYYPVVIANPNGKLDLVRLD